MTHSAFPRLTPALALIAFSLLLAPAALLAQQDEAEEAAPAPPPAPPACSTGAYRQFDFWIGDWEVASNGQPAGTNNVYAIHGGCVLQENWQGTGPGGLSGTSFNIYDQATGRWHQSWVDSSGTLLLLDGGLVDGKMVLSGERPRRDGNGQALHRITWTPNDDGTVRQFWEASTDDGETWSVLFDGLYTRRSEDP